MSSSSLFDLGPERLNRLLSLGKEGPEADADPAVEASAPAPESDSTTEQPGSWIGPYRLVRMLGEGGMGAVYLAEQEHPIRRQVALKVIKPGMDTKRVIARFEAERQVLALLDHPYIAHVFNAGRTKAGRPYFVMEYVEGLPITDYCDRQKLTIEERLRLYQHVCEAIHHAHQKGIIHRDIKASNVLVSRQDGHDVPKVIDFGVAKAMGRTLTEHTFSTEDSQLLGTPEYMSPEQADMVREDIDIRSDVYSLGVLLYVLLAGVLPFDSEAVRSGGIEQLRRIIREKDPVSPSTRFTRLQEGTSRISEDRRTSVVGLRRTLRQELEWIPLKAIQKKREWRYQSVAELGADIDNYLHGKPLRAGPPSKLYSARKFIRRHRFAVLAGASITALALVAIVVLSLSTIIITRQKHQTQAAFAREEQARQEAIQQRDAAYRNLYVAQIRLAPQYWEAGQIRRLTEMLDDYIPRPSETDLRGWEWYYLHSLLHKDLMTLHGHGTGITSAVWRIDGRLVASADKAGTVKVWDATTGQVVLALRGHKGSVSQVAWSPDGKELASAGSDHTARTWDVTSGQEILRFSGHRGGVNAVAWSPTGNELATGSDDNTVRLWNPETGAESFVFETHTAAVQCVAWEPEGRFVASGDDRGWLRIWDAETGREVQAIQPLDHNLWSVAWSPPGDCVASIGYGHPLVVWNLATGQRQHSIPMSAAGKSVAWSPKGRSIATATTSQLIQIWSARTGERLATFRGHTGAVNSIAFSPNGELLLSASDDQTLKIWEVNEPQSALILSHGKAAAIAWCPKGDLLASAGGGVVKLWDAKSGRECAQWIMPEFCVGEDAAEDPALIGWNPEGDRLVTGRWGAPSQKVVVWDSTTGTEVLRLPDGSNPAWSPTGRSLAISVGSEVIVSNIGNDHIAYRLKGHAGPVYALSWSPSGDRIASGEWGPIRIWDGQTGALLQTLVGHRNWVGAIGWSPDGERLASGGWGQEIRIWDARSGKQVATLSGHTGAIHSLHWNPSGQRIASGSSDNVIKIWDFATGRELLSLQGCTDTVRSVAWSPDGRCLASASQDGTVRVWDATRGYKLFGEHVRIRRHNCEGQSSEAGTIRSDGYTAEGELRNSSTGNLIGWWKLDDMEGDTAVDSSGFGNHGKLAGGPKWQPGHLGGALLFDGENDEVSIEGTENWSLSHAVTLASWIKTDAFTKAWQPVITRAHTDSWRLIRQADTRSVEFACAGVDVPGSRWGNVLGTRPVDDGQWHHIAGVYDGTRICLYVDGVLDASSIASGQMNFSTDPVLIGATALDPQNRWKGLIDDVRIYSYALTPEEVKAVYEGRGPGPLPRPARIPTTPTK